MQYLHVSVVFNFDDAAEIILTKLMTRAISVGYCPELDLFNRNA